MPVGIKLKYSPHHLGFLGDNINSEMRQDLTSFPHFPFGSFRVVAIRFSASGKSFEGSRLKPTDGPPRMSLIAKVSDHSLEREKGPCVRIGRRNPVRDRNQFDV